MFQNLFKRAEDTIERTIAQMVVRLLVAIPFLLATGFGVAALWIHMNREFSPEVAALIMGGGFLFLGLIAAIAVASSGRSRPTSEEHEVDETEPPGATHSTTAENGTMASEAERELIRAALVSLAPIALPQLARLAVRNLPVLAVAGVLLFVVSRYASHQAEAAPEASSEAAE